MIFQPSAFAAMPRCTSSTCPILIREGTPSGFSTMSSGRAVGQERHILLRQDAGNNTLVAVTACHLIADS